MRTLLIFVSLMPAWVVAEEVTIKVGMCREEVICLIQKYGAYDITRGMALIGGSREHPLKEIYWEFADYDAIIALSAREGGKVQGLSYWKKEGFKESLVSRGKSEQKITSLKIDMISKEVTVDLKPPPKKQGLAKNRS